MKTYYSPNRWWILIAIVLVPLLSFANNAMKHAVDMTGALVYLGGGAFLGYVAYRVAIGMKMIPLLLVENGVLSYQRYRKETSFDLANVERVERNQQGVWQAVLRDAIVTGDGVETRIVPFPDFSGWRKANWRDAFGAEVRIVI